MAHYYDIMFNVGSSLRGSLINLIYKKSLRLSTAARKETTMGEIINLMQVNTQIFPDISFDILIVITGPIQIILAVVILYYYLENSAFVALGVMLFLIPLVIFVSALLEKLETKKIEIKDSRIKLLNEILNGIKVNAIIL